MPPFSNNWQLIDVHGAGAQRSDPKDGDPKQFPRGRGPQGDDVRIFNFVRCVRGESPRRSVVIATRCRPRPVARLAWTLDAGPAAAGRPYLVVSSASGTAPGLPLLPSPAVLPIVLDAFTSSALSVTNTLAFDRFAGIFDANGRARARASTRLVLFPSTLAGLELSFAFVLVQPGRLRLEPGRRRRREIGCHWGRGPLTTYFWRLSAGVLARSSVGAGWKPVVIGPRPQGQAISRRGCGSSVCLARRRPPGSSTPLRSACPWPVS
jgi:hypothetical protein